MFKEFFRALISPQVRCPNCDQLCGRLTRTGLCQPCKDSLIQPFAPYCYRCHKSFATDLYAGSLNDEKQLICADCTRLHYHFFRRQRSAIMYNQPAQELINQYKFRGKRSLAKPLARMLRLTYDEYFADCTIDLISSIPLHPRRLRERSFNQSELLALGLSKLTGLPYAPTLIKEKATLKQSKQERAERFRQTKQSFRLATAELAGKRILVIDDIYTTGATVEEAAMILIKAGAEEIYVLTVARAYDQEVL